ncbi:hypothetical protein RRG08_039763 [Elysia crispata]|uniref:Uncharacterized protein n=1 Tax=Elysia crispata TaxID=231223 RepID=A0AAE1DMY4_9GAST|nr:hypothetical protein RRG08_039763 [Elysia crispata]
MRSFEICQEDSEIILQWTDYGNVSTTCVMGLGDCVPLGIRLISGHGTFHLNGAGISLAMVLSISMALECALMLISGHGTFYLNDAGMCFDADLWPWYFLSQWRWNVL